MIASVPETGPRPAPPEIRRARPEEYAEVGALVVAAYAAGGLLDNDRGYGAHVADVTGRAAEHPVLVASREGRLVGSVTITPHGSPQSEIAAEDEVELRYLGVAPEAWGTGVAQALVAGCEDYALETHARALVLCVISDNTVAHRLYTRLGFHRVPERDWSPAPGVDLWAFERPVDPEMWRHSTPGRAVTPPLGVGLSASLTFTVDEGDTATALGSGDVAVLATPRLLAWLEAATVECLRGALAPGSTSVGTRVELEHRAASPVGADVLVRASVSHVDGRLVRFEVAAEHLVDGDAPVIVATGRITRVTVDRTRFLARLGG